MVGGREFVVAPVLGKVQRELEIAPAPTNTDGIVKWIVQVLNGGRVSQPVTEEWLIENGITTEYGDVISAFVEVTTGKKAPQPGEAPAP